MDIYQKNTIRFLKKYGMDLAMAIKDTGIFLATPIAQCAIESGYGTSPVAIDCNNFKGISAGAKYSQGRCSGHSRWAVFASPYDCFRSYAYFVTNKPQYQNALLQTTPERQIFELVVGGYCTEPRSKTPKQIATDYTKSCRTYLNAMQQIGIGGKIGIGGNSLAQLGTSISNLNIT
jgi:flagellum-specific peptidoglycan hydrolase FlgJ